MQASCPILFSFLPEVRSCPIFSNEKFRVRHLIHSASRRTVMRVSALALIHLGGVRVRFVVCTDPSSVVSLIWAGGTQYLSGICKLVLLSSTKQVLKHVRGQKSVFQASGMSTVPIKNSLTIHCGESQIVQHSIRSRTLRSIFL